MATCLKEKQKKIESKYHQVAKQFESKFELIHLKVTSRFHREVLEIKRVRSSLNDLIAKSTASVERKIKSKSKTSIFSKTSTKKGFNSDQENIDWTRGRFSGQTMQIVVRDGKIMEKVFLTSKGNKISVKRNRIRTTVEVKSDL